MLSFFNQPGAIIRIRIRLEIGRREEVVNAKGEKAMPEDDSPSRLIDKRIQELNDWRGQKLAYIRSLIIQAEPDVVEEWKWRGVPVWSHNGIICTGETYKSVVKLTFAQGAVLDDPSGLFNASLDGNVRRAIDISKDDAVDEEAFKTLIHAAIALNATKVASRRARVTPAAGRAPRQARAIKPGQ